LKKESPVAALLPLITHKEHALLVSALKKKVTHVECSLDLGLSISQITVTEKGWIWQNQSFPYLKKCKERTIYHWVDSAFEPISRYSDALIKLIATDWGAPTFEIDGIKMLPTAKVSPYIDAKNKVELIEPAGKTILDTCGGLGYFASWCIKKGAKKIHSFEKNPDVVWLRGINPWSPQTSDVLELTLGSINEHVSSFANNSIDAVLHDPPRFGIAGELYSQAFYNQLARVLKHKGKLFHYTGMPNKLTSGRNVPQEVIKRLEKSGFTASINGDGVFAIKN